MASGAIHRADEIWLYYAVADMTHGNYDVARDKFKGAINLWSGHYRFTIGKRVGRC